MSEERTLDAYGDYDNSDLDEECLEKLNERLPCPQDDDKKFDADEVETGPPIVKEKDDEDGLIFKPRGWVGKYTENVRVKPHMDGIGFEEMQSSVTRWIEKLGPDTARTVLEYLPDTPIMTEERYRLYSQLLIEQTEDVLAHRPPVETEFVRETGFSPRGKPLPGKTAVARARQGGAPVTVTQNVNFTTETASNALLIRFHLELAGKLQELSDTSDIETDFRDRIEYHSEFVSNQFPRRLVDEALKSDFNSPDRIANLRKSASPEVETVIDLWDAFLSDVGLKLDVKNRLNTTMLPAEKVYELYVLQHLIGILEEITGNQAEIEDLEDDDSTEGIKVEFESTEGYDKIALRYDMEVEGDYSQFLKGKPFHGNSGRPDFLLVADLNEDESIPVWVGDAKFKEELANGDDGERFIRYMMDLLEPGKESPRTGTLILPILPKGLEVDKKRISRGEGGYKIEFQSLRPEGDENREDEETDGEGSAEEYKQELKKHLQEGIELSPSN
jgi:hypothetical protein